MRHVLLAVLVTLVGSLPAAPRVAAQDVVPDAALADAVVRFWIDARSEPASAPVRATVRQRRLERRGSTLFVIADVLISHGRSGTVTTFEAEARPGATGALEIVGLKPLAHLPGLTRLVLDTEQQFAVRNLRFTAPDLVITLESGEAFGASSDGGLSTLVLRGRGQLRFTPPQAAEQGQLRIATGRPALETSVEDLVIRMNPGDLSKHLSSGSLITTSRDAKAAGRAQEIFDRLVGRAYSVNLGDLSAERWALLPPPGNLAVEFRSRHGWLTYVRSGAEPEDVTLFDRERRRHISQYASIQRARFFDEDGNATYDIVGYDVDLAFDPARNWIGGRGALKVRIAADAVRTLSFRLAESLTISSTTSPELGRLLAFRVIDQTTVVVGLPSALSRGQEVTIDFAYSGRLDPEPSGSETMTIQAPIADMPPLQRPEPRWFYGNRSYWYPQGLTTDYAPATMRLLVPPPYAVVATGIRAASDSLAASEPIRFVSERPVRYLGVEIGRFAPVDADTARGLAVVATPRRANANRGLIAKASAILDFYASTFGEAAYPGLTVTAVDAVVPGGHAPAYFAVIQQPLPATPFTWRDDPLAFDRYPDVLLAHEIAHQWWGQAVGFKSYRDQWLSEGLAQYSALAFITKTQPDLERGLIARMRETAEEYAASGPIHLGYRLGHLEGRAAPFRAVVYNKSALVLDMLRRLVGDEPFARGLQRFYRDWRFKKAGTDDLRLAFEAETGQSLTRFFERWVLGSALPRLRAHTTIARDGGYADVRVEQEGETFDLPLTIGLDYGEGRIEEVTLAIREPLVDTRIPIKAGLRRIVTKDPRTLADYLD